MRHRNLLLAALAAALLVLAAPTDAQAQWRSHGGPAPSIGGIGGGSAVRNARTPPPKRGLPAARKVSRAPPLRERRYVGNEVLLGLPSNLSPQALDLLAQRHHLTRLESQRIEITGTTIHRWRITDGRSVADVVRALEADTSVPMAQPNYRFTLQEAQPPANVSASPARPYAWAKLRVPEAHRLATGSHVLIAVIDNAIDTAHPDIAPAVVEHFDAIEAVAPPAAHGTAMAGAIVARGRLTGVAPSARILAVEAFAPSSAGYESTSLAILRGIDWAVARGARVINMSFAGPRDPEIARGIAAAAGKGVVLVAAAGNAGPRSAPLYPAADPNVIAVTAVDDADRLFAIAVHGRHIAVAAPGVDVVAPAPGGAYQMSTGTSIAAAHVSGIAALLIELQPALTPAAVRKLLTSTANDLGPRGRDNRFGAGLADAYRAAAGASASARAPAPSLSAAR